MSGMKSQPLHFQISSSEEDELTSIEFSDDFPTKHIGYSKRSYLLKFWHNQPRASTAALMFIVFVLPLFISTLYLADDTSSNGSGKSSSSGGEFDSTAPVDPLLKYATTSDGGMVATDNEQCSNLGAHILKQGGSAADAAVAATLCLGVVSPASSGLGGGCFILHYEQSSGEAVFIDAREVAPAAAFQDMYEDDPLEAQNGAKAIAVPGELLGLHQLWQAYGVKTETLDWAHLVEPASEMAAKWEISDYLGQIIEEEWDTLSLPEFAPLKALYTRDDGTRKQAGDTVEQRNLQMSLMEVAINGPRFLYEVEASTIAGEVQDLGGILTEADIKGYNTTWRAPIRASLLGATYLGAPLPSSGGGAIGTILKFMAGFEMPLPAQTTLNDLYSHRLAEAMKHAFALRMNLGDPAFVNGTEEVVSAMLNDTYVDMLRTTLYDDHSVLNQTEYGGPLGGFQEEAVDDDAARRRLKKHGTGHMRGSILPEDHGTSHVSVVDKDGNAVALTSTINTYFGSKILSESVGIILNNQMDDFSLPGQDNYFGLPPAEKDFIAPGKKPLSSMSPSIILTDVLDASSRQVTQRPWLVGGASGGPHIITATAQVLLNYLARGMDLLTAVSTPRIHHQLSPYYVDVENRTVTWGDDDELTLRNRDDVTQTLLIRGQEVNQRDGSVGVSQFVEWSPLTNAFTGVSDPRKNGRPEGG